MPTTWWPRPSMQSRPQDKLILPGVWGSDVPILDGVPFFRRLVEQREAYRKLRADGARKLRPAGYRLAGHLGRRRQQIKMHCLPYSGTSILRWSRKGLPAICRRQASSSTTRYLSAWSTTVVVNYDVFGNVGHQALTRLYMDMIRMEAEELFLDFLPPSQRAGLRNSWYRGGPFTDLKLRYVFPLVNRSAPTGISYRNQARAKAEFVERVINEHLPTQVRGPPDVLNWRLLRLPQGGAALALTPTEQALRKIASIKAASAMPFARFFPDLVVVLVRGKHGVWVALQPCS